MGAAGAAGAAGAGGAGGTALRLLVLDDGAALWLYVCLGGARRVLVECRREGRRGKAPLAYLRELGELGPLKPLSEHLRPQSFDPALWLGILSLLRGLAFRRGGAFVFWQAGLPGLMPEGAVFSYAARVVARAVCPEPAEGRALVLGLGGEELLALAPQPASLVANSSLAVKLAGPALGPGALLLGGDLRPAAWRRLLGEGGCSRLLGGVARYAEGAPSTGYDLARGLKMAALPWLALGALETGGWERQEGAARVGLATPEVGALAIAVDQDGLLRISGHQWEGNGLCWRGLACPPGDEFLPTPWPLRKALEGARDA